MKSSMRSNWFSGVKSHRTPATLGLVVALAIGFLVGWLLADGRWYRLAGFDTQAPSPLGFVAYPLASGFYGLGLLCFLFALYWLWMIGTTLERDLSSKTWLIVWGVATIVGASIVWLAALITKTPFNLLGPYWPIAAVTMIWCARQPESQILMMGLIPLKAKILAILTVVFLVIGFGAGAPLFGLLSALPLGLFWLYGSGRLPGLAFGRSPASDHRLKVQKTKEFHSFIDDVRKREEERAEREKLRELFERSARSEEKREDA